MRRAENFVILRRKKIEVSKPFYVIHDNYYSAIIHEHFSTEIRNIMGIKL